MAAISDDSDDEPILPIAPPLGYREVIVISDSDDDAPMPPAITPPRSPRQEVKRGQESKQGEALSLQPRPQAVQAPNVVSAQNAQLPNQALCDSIQLRVNHWFNQSQ